MDSDIAFYFWFHSGDARLAVGLVQSIRTLYRHEPVIAIADGEVESNAIVSAGAQVFVKPHLKEFGQCGKFLATGLETVLEVCPASGRFICVDPETRFHRVAYLPPGDWVGQIKNEKTIGIAALGAGALFSRSALEDALTPLRTDASDYRYTVDGIERPSADLTLAATLKSLKYEPKPWSTPEGISEVCLKHEPDPKFESGPWAITHPHREV